MSRPGMVQARRHLPLALITAGAALLLYVGTQYTTMYRQQRQLARQWEQQQHAPAATPSGTGLTRLAIPRINLDAIVVEGTTRHDLLRGPGHMKNTATPGGTGNSVITAHRDTFFRHIFELNKGDIVTVERDGKTYRYAVAGKKVVKPDDLSVIQPSTDARLTLVTCYPTYYIGPAPDRLVVFSKLLDSSDPSAVAQNPALAPENKPAK